MRKIFMLLVVSALFFSGCAVNFYKKSPADKAKIEELSSEVDKLNAEMKRERRQFEDIRRELQKKLKGKVTLELEERGLVIILANNILFDSGQAKIKPEAYSVLDKIADVIKSKASEKNIGIEGHTDNVPIKYSGWPSNRELSTARANEVYHYLVDKGGLSPSKLTTMGYGEHRPVASNDTKAGRAKNRRVEIVILPQFKREAGSAVEEARQVTPTETEEALK